jgi:hypothetical protein
MYCPGLLVKVWIICEPNAPCFLSSSILSLFEVTKAISIPEKKAERIIIKTMTKKEFMVQK